MRAIERVMAVIEFDLNGQFLHANDNFLEAMGYTIAADVEKQTETTNEMANHTVEAISRIGDVMESISGVVETSGESATGADGVQAASAELARMAADMQSAVNGFVLASASRMP